VKQVASYLATAIFLVDPVGNLVYYNEAAEQLLGRRYDEVGEMAVEEWGTVFEPTDESGAPIPLDENPLARALRNREPETATLWIQGLDGVAHHISVSAIPLIGQQDRDLGALAIFWECGSR